jgi:hypothetical protein
VAMVRRHDRDDAEGASSKTGAPSCLGEPASDAGGVASDSPASRSRGTGPPGGGVGLSNSAGSAAPSSVVGRVLR